MWLKRDDNIYNLDHIDKINLEFDTKTNRYYFVLTSATRETKEHEYKIGPFGGAEAKACYSEIITALKNDEKLWEFPEKPAEQKF